MDYSLIGAMEARNRGSSVDLGGLKQRAVLAVLILARGRVVDVDKLVDDVWDGTPPVKALVSLRAYVANLRKVLDTPDAPRTRLVTTSSGYRLDLGTDTDWPDVVDIDLFERLSSTAHEASTDGHPAAADDAASHALELWRGSPLADFRDHGFAFDEIQRLESLCAQTREIRTEARLLLGQGDVLVPELEARLRSDPLREKTWSQLMLALHHSGRRADALIVFDRATATLRAELGVEPGAELTSLNDEIRRAPLSSVERTTHHTVVGREDELTRLHEVLRGAVDGRGRLVVITGDSGIGKTALSSEISADAREEGFATAWCSWVASERKPLLWAWTRVLDRLRSDDGATAPVTASALRWAIGSTPTLIVLDDFHCADRASQEFLTEIEGWIADSPLVVVATWHDGHPSLPRRKGFSDRVLGRSDVTVMKLTSLTAAATADVIENIGGAVPSAELVARIHSQTGGNPLYIREAVRMLRAESTVRE